MTVMPGSRAAAGLRAVMPGLTGHLLPLLLLALTACTRPVWYEEFIRTEDAPAGIYEFTPDLSDTLSTYDISFYTSAPSDPLELQISWLAVENTSAGKASVQAASPESFPSSPEKGSAGKAPDSAAVAADGLPSAPVQAASPESFPSSPEKGSAGKAPVSAAAAPRLVFSEIVWYPAGQNQVPYRSAIRPSSSAVTPTSSVTSGSAVTPDPIGGPPTYLLRVKITNPPTNFRGLGIICKRNDGTR